MPPSSLNPSPEDARDPAAVAVLVDNHRAFLRYLERRIGSRDMAEDILQDALDTSHMRNETAAAASRRVERETR